MSELVIPNGVLSVFPYDAEMLAMAVPLSSLDTQAVTAITKDVPLPDITEYPEGHEPPEELEADYRTQFRSVDGQLGLEVQPTVLELPVVYKKHLHIPLYMIPHTEIAEAILSDFHALKDKSKPGNLIHWQKQTREIGRIVNFDEMRHLGRDEVTQAMNEGLIEFGPVENAVSPPRINEDGSATMHVSFLKYLFNHHKLAKFEQRFDVGKHGRAGLIPIMDSVPMQPDEELPEFFVGGAAFSTGPFYWKIREKVGGSGNVKQLVGASFGDGYRSGGLRDTHDDYSRHRQVELVGGGQTIAETEITIDFYRPRHHVPAPHPAVNWWNMSREERHKRHLAGLNPLDVLNVGDPGSREVLFSKVSDSEVGGIIMSAHGVSEIPRGQTDRFMAQNTLAAARSFGIGRSIPEHLKDLTPFIEALKPAGDRSRVAILDRILAEDIPGIAKSGDVRAFLLRDFGPLAMTKEIHNVLVDVVRTGVAIEWANGERRKFHRSGLWMKPEQVDRMEELDLVFAMYGTHKDAIDKRLKPQIQDFLAGMTDLVPAYNLGVTHGNGPGVMRIADEVARAYGIMSLGVGIDVEALGQGKANLLPEGVAIFKASERLYRQEMLDKLNTISIFNVGGFGTLEEASITLCTHKLLSRLSAPSILVDPDNLYRHVKAQFDEISNRKTITIGGEVVDLSNSPLGQAWVSNTIHRVKDYDEAQTIVQDYWNNPADYWERAGLSKQDVAMGLQNHMEVAARLGMRLAYNLTTAAKAFISN